MIVPHFFDKKRSLISLQQKPCQSAEAKCGPSGKIFPPPFFRPDFLQIP
jgi:hypothetical protein